MSARTGLGTAEVAVLEALDALGATSTARYRRSTQVLATIEAAIGLGPRHAYPLLADLGAPWRLHLPLLDRNGNWGGQGDDGPAEARYTELRLGRIGELALAAERGEVGPVPLGLIEGSLWRGGGVPPFAPTRILAALRTGADPGPPALPRGGRLVGDLESLLRGDEVRLERTCTFVEETNGRGQRQLIITEVPLGVSTDLVARQLEGRVLGSRRTMRHVDGSRTPPRNPAPLLDVHDESSGREGIRIVGKLDDTAGWEEASAYLRSVWPVTTLVDCRLPAPLTTLLSSWDAGDGSGLDALEGLLAS